MGLHMMTTAEPLAELFRERVRLSPEAPAYRVFDHARGDWAELSWRAMDERVARRVQAGLARKGWFARLLFRTAVDVGWRAFEHRQGRARWHPALLFDRPWTVEEGLFTPTLKLKRPTILARHAQRIDALYARHD